MSEHPGDPLDEARKAMGHAQEAMTVLKGRIDDIAAANVLPSTMVTLSMMQTDYQEAIALALLDIAESLRRMSL